MTSRRHALGFSALPGGQRWYRSRLIADIGIHLRGWTRKQALRTLRRRNLAWSND